MKLGITVQKMLNFYFTEVNKEFFFREVYTFLLTCFLYNLKSILMSVCTVFVIFYIVI